RRIIFRYNANKHRCDTDFAQCSQRCDFGGRRGLHLSIACEHRTGRYIHNVVARRRVHTLTLSDLPSEYVVKSVEYGSQDLRAKRVAGEAWADIPLSITP